MPLKKNIGLRNEYTESLTVFQAHFTDFLNLAGTRLVCLFISSLCKVRSVNFSKLLSGFDNNAAASSNQRRIEQTGSWGLAIKMWLFQNFVRKLHDENCHFSEFACVQNVGQKRKLTYFGANCFDERIQKPQAQLSCKMKSVIIWMS